MNFSELGLCDELSQAVADLGYTSPTPIQEKSIPYVLMGRDILGSQPMARGTYQASGKKEINWKEELVGEL